MAVGVQYFSGVPLLYYLQTVHFLKTWNIFHEYHMQQSLKLGGNNYHLKWIKVPGTAPY
jgi:hypothetical protein